jgi:hypothetical protein
MTVSGDLISGAIIESCFSLVGKQRQVHTNSRELKPTASYREA